MFNHSVKGTGVERADAWLLVGALAAALWCWLETNGRAAKADTFQAAAAAAIRMHQDAERIQSLRSKPQVVTDRLRPNDELIAQIESAMRAANVGAEHWVANEPIPAVRVPKSPYQQLAVRLTFEDVDLRQTVEMAHSLLEADSTLSIGRLRLTAPAADSADRWTAEIVVAYLLYSP